MKSTIRVNGALRRRKRVDQAPASFHRLFVQGWIVVSARAGIGAIPGATAGNAGEYKLNLYCSPFILVFRSMIFWFRSSNFPDCFLEFFASLFASPALLLASLASFLLSGSALNASAADALSLAELWDLSAAPSLFRVL